MEATVRKLIKEAMKEGNKVKQVTYKNVLETAQKTAKKTQSAVTDDMVVQAVKTEIKQLNDVLPYYKEETKEYEEVTDKIAWCTALLPRMATEQEVMDFLVSSAAEKNMGKCMKVLKEKFGSQLDGKAASAVVKKYLEG